ncbi:hypothetical protein Sa4125_27860 [Aureimonas sp. SA4125]|uniref:hypothetical protein n=1 Tax=Aureimonas sp. SA4125 TaxID=2826993 RepID=UPI001CC34671|nr:hypothetical protein [Aureimonas sp. SA4125]BDA85244.1 hypothetical protein Sa4125_27860 [Aureimonas sp. SA4125]
MPIFHSSIDQGNAGVSFAPKRSIELTLNEEVLAAVEGWRQAHGMADQSQALGELVVLGLMSEIGRIYRLATGAAGSSADTARRGAGDGEAAAGPPWM